MGKVCTQALKEDVIQWEMGRIGCCTCIFLVPVSFYNPIIAFACFGILSNYLRSRIVTLYNIEDESCNCGSCNPIVNYTHFACSYPCSLFQVYVSVRQWELEKLKSVQVTSNTLIS